MKKNTISILEAIKKKIKKIDDSDEAGSDNEISKEFEYIDHSKNGQQVESNSQNTDEIDNSKASDLELETNIEDILSNSQSGSKQSGDSSSSQDLEYQDDELNSGEDDFDLSFENEDLEDEDSIDLNDIGSEERQENFSDNVKGFADDSTSDDSRFLREDTVLKDENSDAGFNLESTESDFMELDKPQNSADDVKDVAFDKDLLANRGMEELSLETPVKEDLDNDFKPQDELELQIDNSLDDNELDNEFFNKKDKIQSEVETSQAEQQEIQENGIENSKLQGEGSLNLDDISDDELEILSESEFTVDEEPQRKKGGLVAKSLSDIIAEEKLGVLQNSSSSYEQENGAGEDFLNSQADTPNSDNSAGYVANQDLSEKNALDLPDHNLYTQNGDVSGEVESDNIDVEQQMNDFLEDRDGSGVENESEVVETNIANAFENEKHVQDSSLDKSEEYLDEDDSQVGEDIFQDREESSSNVTSEQKEVEVVNGDLNRSDNYFTEGEAVVRPASMQLQYNLASDADHDIIVNSEISSKVSQSIKELSDAKSMVSKVSEYTKGDMLSHVAFELMKPKLEKWFNENLPKLVENVVREEIKKIISDNNKA